MRTGQYTLIEQVVLFTLGISITLGFLYAFNDIKAEVETDMKDSQSELVAEYVASSSIELIESGAEGNIRLPIPQNIASEQYAATASDAGILVQVSGDQALASIYGLGSKVSPDGSVQSQEGTATLYLEDSDLTLRGGQ